MTSLRLALVLVLALIACTPDAKQAQKKAVGETPEASPAPSSTKPRRSLWFSKEARGRSISGYLEKNPNPRGTYITFELTTTGETVYSISVQPDDYGVVGEQTAQLTAT